MTLRSSQAESFFGSAHPIVRVVLDTGPGIVSPGGPVRRCSLARRASWAPSAVDNWSISSLPAPVSMLAEGTLSSRLDLPLGPEIGQCCGGRVEVSHSRACAEPNGTQL